MKKDNYHDYVVDAMRYYAACDRPDARSLKKLRDVLPPEGMGCYRDLRAVERMLYRLKNEEYGPTGVRCVEMVYFAAPSHTPSRGEITERVSDAARELCMCEASVYKALRRARTLVALERGLRIDEESILRR